MRSSSGGWVLNSPAMRPPRSGFTMKRWAVASGTCIGSCCAPISSFSSADASASGSRTTFAPSRSAWYSRVRLMPRRINDEAMGATMIASSIAIPPPLRRLPPKKNAAKPISEIALAIVATIELVRMSRFFTCAISWPSTPRSSRSVSSWRMPVVTATAACFGLRPVAKAFGCGESMM